MSRPTGEAWEVRAARNQSLFRAINEELRTSAPSARREELVIACECADTDCVETIAIGVAEYEDIRANATHFVVVNGHVYRDVERVVRENSSFSVVEKLGAAAEVAAATSDAPPVG